MKKAYSAPNIIFERFSLDENIAATNGNCSRTVKTFSNGSCGLEFGDKMVFTIPVAGCCVKIEDGSPLFDGLCYHIPYGDNKLFNS
jgi:hypothetical protein